MGNTGMLRDNRRSRIEALEPRTLLSGGTISGRTFYDGSYDGVRQSREKWIHGEFVWLDRNNDGAWDVGEPQTKTAGSVGAYTFTNLKDGVYHVRHQLGANSVSTAPIDGLRTVTIAKGRSVGSQDFGFAAGGTVSGVVEFDDNADGLHDY